MKTCENVATHDQALAWDVHYMTRLIDGVGGSFKILGWVNVRAYSFANGFSIGEKSLGHADTT